MQPLPKSLQAAVVSRIKVVSEMDIAERRIPQDGRFRIKFERREIDFRVSTLPTYYGEKVVLRILDKGVLQLEMEKLGFEDQPLTDFRESLSRPNGIILVTGPTGSGKTTTLYSALYLLNNPDVNIVTVEDPVEYEIFGVNQVQVKPEVGLTFASGLRSILRQDPDIVMIGEIRDEETADIAIKAALTGHLVLSTLHTNDAPGAITRLIDMGMEPFLISSSLLMAAAQRLVRRICPDCKDSYFVPEQVLKRAQFNFGPDEKVELFKGKGCARCGETGYRGRLAVLEVLRVKENVQDLIMASAPSGEIKCAAIENGMQTLRQIGLRKVKAGLTTLEEALRVTAPD
jgi:type IV pilus assembly protein PilB